MTDLMPAADIDGTHPGVRYCGAPTLEGGTCRQVVGIHSASGLCIWHDPARTEEATAARQVGAEQMHSRPRDTDVPPPPAPTTLQGVCDWLSWVTVALASGQIDKSRATGCSYALQNLRAALTMRDLEAKYKALEARVAALQRGPR